MATTPNVTVDVDFSDWDPAIATMLVDAIIWHLRLSRRDPRFRRLGAEHWILHHAPKPHPPVKPNRRVDELRAVAVEVIAEEAATDGS